MTKKLPEIINIIDELKFRRLLKEALHKIVSSYDEKSNAEVIISWHEKFQRLLNMEYHEAKQEIADLFQKNPAEAKILCRRFETIASIFLDPEPILRLTAIFQKFFPKNFELMALAGSAFIKLKDYEKGEYWYIKAANTDPETRDHYFVWLGHNMVDAGEYERALHAYSHVYRIENDDKEKIKSAVNIAKASGLHKKDLKLAQQIKYITGDLLNKTLN